MTIVRPRHIRGTPRRLAELLNTSTKAYPSARNTYDAEEDIFTIYPDPAQVRNRGSRYDLCYGFFSGNKFQQRQALRGWGAPTPETFRTHEEAAGSRQGQFVVRPFRHSGGSHYRVTDNPRDFIEGSEYISAVFPKTREYRWIFVRGQPAVFLRKKPDEGIQIPGVAEPWNHTRGMFFRTVAQPNNSRLPQAAVLAALGQCPVVQAADLIGIDILFNQRDNSWVVCEINACPGISIEENLSRIADIFRGQR